jgi:hypothetical protein
LVEFGIRDAVSHPWPLYEAIFVIDSEAMADYVKGKGAIEEVGKRVFTLKLKPWGNHMMKLIDHAGNSIVPGRMLRWQHDSTHSGPLDFYVKVRDTVAPSVDMPGRLVFEVTIGVPPQKKQDGAIQFKDFVTVYDPEDELRAQAVLAKVVGG